MPKRRTNAVNYTKEEPFHPGAYIRASRLNNEFGQNVLTMPWGPGTPKDWIYPEEAPPSSSAAPNAFGRRGRGQRRRRSRNRHRSFGQEFERYKPLDQAKLSQSGYLSLWDAPPVNMPPSWNPLQLQGGNIYPQHLNRPKLRQIKRF